MLFYLHYCIVFARYALSCCFKTRFYGGFVLCKKAGIAIKPATPVSEVLPYVKSADMVLVMTVEPGFGGQGFMSETLGKIRELRDYINRECPNVHIQVDGGINAETAALVREAGADILVAGSYLFKAADMAAAAGSMR